MMWLIARGFSKTENPNEWSKDNWIVRFFEKEVEIFENNCENKVGKYYKGNVVDLDFEAIMEEIDKDLVR